MKKYLTIALIPIVISSCGRGHVPYGPEITEGLQYTHFAPELYNEEHKTSRPSSLLLDSHFRNGFALQNQDTAHPEVVRTLDYGGKRDTSYINPSRTSRESATKTYWNIAPWWAPEECSFKTDECIEEDYAYKYRNDTRELIVDPVNGELTISVNAMEENMRNYGRKTISDNENWSHHLFQQGFKDININDYREIHLVLDIEFDYLEYLGDNSYAQGNECAQFLIYFSPWESVNHGGWGSGASMWYGVPILDTRYSSIAFYAQKDFAGGPGGRFIFNMPSALYMGEDWVKTDHKYHIDVDVLNIPNYNIYSAFEYAYAHNFIPREADRNNLYIGYINIGWEIPGPLNVSATISNFDIYTVQ